MSKAKIMLKRLEREQKLRVKYWKRLFSNAYLEEDTNCWIVNFSPATRTPQIGVEQVLIQCSRVAYTLLKKAIPDKQEVCHICDNPRCINPAHLFLGTHQENMDDMVSKNRVSTHMRKLSDSQVIEIKKLLFLKKEHQDIANQLNISVTAVHDISAGRTYLGVL